MKHHNLISIILPCYNSEDYIENSIKSVLKQTYKKWELIIVDDGSSDNSYNIIRKYQKKYNNIKVIKFNKNKGVSIARNKAIKNSKGSFITFLDSDDLWKKDKLKKQLGFMLDNDIAFSFTGYEYIDDKGFKTGKKISVPKKVNYYNLLKENVIACFTVMINKSKINNIYMPNIKHEDYATWLNILKNYYGYGLNISLGYYRKNNNSLSSNKIKSSLWRWDIYRNHQNLSLLSSLYYFSFYMFNGIRKHS